MRDVKDTKGNVIYRLVDDKIVPEGPLDNGAMHVTLREKKSTISRNKLKASKGF